MAGAGEDRRESGTQALAVHDDSVTVSNSADPVVVSRERTFVLFAGLKGDCSLRSRRRSHGSRECPVPLLLGTLLLPVPHGHRAYGVVVIVVVVSVVGQGSLVPTVARLLRIEMRAVEQEPYTLGVRLRDAPQGAHRLTVQAGSQATGSALADLPGLAEGTWVSAIVRSGQLVPVRARTELEVGDEVLLLIDPEQHDADVLCLFAPISKDR